VARGLLRARWSEIERRGCTLIGVSVGALDDHAAQLSLPLDDAPDPALDDTIDAVRRKFGSASVRRAVQLGHGEREGQPILPD
jgi:DNA polymerase-4